MNRKLTNPPVHTTMYREQLNKDGSVHHEKLMFLCSTRGNTDLWVPHSHDGTYDPRSTVSIPNMPGQYNPMGYATTKGEAHALLVNKLRGTLGDLEIQIEQTKRSLEKVEETK